MAFFREQYGAASTSMSEANAELERQASIAIGQAKTGVAALRALYEAQVATLNGEVTRWHGLCHVLQGESVCSVGGNSNEDDDDRH